MLLNNNQYKCNIIKSFLSLSLLANEIREPNVCGELLTCVVNLCVDILIPILHSLLHISCFIFLVPLFINILFPRNFNLLKLGHHYLLTRVVWDGWVIQESGIYWTTLSFTHPNQRMEGDSLITHPNSGCPPLINNELPEMTYVHSVQFADGETSISHLDKSKKSFYPY